MNAPAPSPPDMRERPPLGVEVHLAWKLFGKRPALASNWFSVDGLDITSDRSGVALRRGGQIVAQSAGAGDLVANGRFLRAHRLSRWGPFSTLPIGDGRFVEIDYAERGVYCGLRVMPDDVRLGVADLGIGLDRGCRINLIAGLIDTEVALRCLVYFWAELEADYRSST